MRAIEILEEKYLCLAEVLEELEGIEEKNYFQNKALSHIKKVCKLDPKKARELKEKLKGLGIRRLSDADICKIVDILPQTIDELKAIIMYTGKTFTKDELEKILQIVKEYTPQ